MQNLYSLSINADWQGLEFTWMKKVYFHAKLKWGVTAIQKGYQ